MIASWMFYSVVCALAFGLAATLAERMLIAGRRPVRHVWIVAVMLSLVAPVVAFRNAPRTTITAPATLAAIDESGPAENTEVAAPVARETASTSIAAKQGAWSASWRGLIARADEPLKTAWLALSLALALHFMAGIVILWRTRRTWSRRVVNGVPVLVSERTGPALVGALSPAIVVPEWVLQLDAPQLDLMLRHEQEHRRAHDGRMLFAAQFALIAMPWNLALWWMLLRLRVAVELDCDARVLRDTDARSYGALLLEMVRPRPMLEPAGVTSFAERATQLERRIKAIGGRHKKAMRGARAVAALVIVAVIAAAWIAPTPRGPIQVVQTAPQLASAPARDATPAAPVVRKPATPKPAPAKTVTAPPDTTAPAKAAPPAVASTTVADSTPPQPVPLQLPPGLGGRGRGNGLAIIDIYYERLFGGITMTPEQIAQAKSVITRLLQEQGAIQDSMRPQLDTFNLNVAKLRTTRDSTLQTIVSNDADRATLTSRLNPGGGRRGGPPPGGARGGGGGGRNPSPVLNDSALADAAFARLFEGITLTPDAELRARQAIIRMQTDQRAVTPPRIRQVIGLSPQGVLIEARSDSTLMSLLTSEEDRQKLRARMITPLRDR